MKKISPSMMCVEFENTKKYLDIFREEGIEYLHIDVMDGVFVPNFTLGTDYVKHLRTLTDIPLDVHLMIDEPEKKIDWFDFREGEIVSVHAESTRHLQRTLQMIRKTGASAMVALNPATPLNTLDYVLDDICGVLIMTVNPGFAGQKAVPMAVAKISECRKYLEEKGYGHLLIEVDGNVSYDLAGQMSAGGADVFVAGTSSFLRGLDGLADGIRRLRSVIGEEK